MLLVVPAQNSKTSKFDVYNLKCLPRHLSSSTFIFWHSVSVTWANNKTKTDFTGVISGSLIFLRNSLAGVEKHSCPTKAFYKFQTAIFDYFFLEFCARARIWFALFKITILIGFPFKICRPPFWKDLRLHVSSEDWSESYHDVVGYQWPGWSRWGRESWRGRGMCVHLLFQKLGWRSTQLWTG